MLCQTSWQDRKCCQLCALNPSGSFPSYLICKRDHPQLRVVYLKMQFTQHCTSPGIHHTLVPKQRENTDPRSGRGRGLCSNRDKPEINAEKPEKLLPRQGPRFSPPSSPLQRLWKHSSWQNCVNRLLFPACSNRV